MDFSVLYPTLDSGDIDSAEIGYPGDEDEMMRAESRASSATSSPARTGASTSTASCSSRAMTRSRRTRTSSSAWWPASTSPSMTRWRTPPTRRSSPPRRPRSAEHARCDGPHVGGHQEEPDPPAGPHGRDRVRRRDHLDTTYLEPSPRTSSRRTSSPTSSSRPSRRARSTPPAAEDPRCGQAGDPDRAGVRARSPSSRRAPPTRSPAPIRTSCAPWPTGLA